MADKLTTAAEVAQQRAAQVDVTQAQEVKSLREPQRPPEHCGRKMRKLQMPLQRPKRDENEPDVVTVYSCDECGHQVRL